MIFPQRTLAQEVTFSGLGLHSGRPVQVTVHPSNEGLFFRTASDRFEAIPANVTDTQRCTRLGTISTVEHLLSAMAARGITHAEVVLDGNEMPALDGSALPYYVALGNTTELPDVEMEGLFARIYEKGESGYISIARGEGHCRYEFVVEGAFPGVQTYECMFTPEVYESQIAPARTIAFEHEVELARQAGLGLGLDETSCLVLGKEGYVNSARFSDEPARHKLLDLIGDLWLARVPISMLNLIGERTGHRANVSAAQKLSEAVRRK